MRDLDIRGMGNMLGAEQSGYIAEMGFETYQRILAEAFEEIKGTVPDLPGMKEEDQTYVTDCVVDTDLEILIPDTYINITAERTVSVPYRRSSSSSYSWFGSGWPPARGDSRR